MASVILWNFKTKNLNAETLRREYAFVIQHNYTQMLVNYNGITL